MPDIRFEASVPTSKIYFSANTPSKGKFPLLVPIFDNPNFLDPSTFNIVSPPGIKQIIQGDLGITEKLLSPIFNPIVEVFMLNTFVTESIGSTNNLTSKEDIKSFLLSQFIPKDQGFKPLEKAIITSMLESYKPFIDLLLILLESMGIAEDVYCRFLASYIKVGKLQMGIKSRIPKTWNKDLKYTETITYTMKQLLDGMNMCKNELEKSMSDKHALKNPTPKVDTDKEIGTLDLPAYYIGYFDEQGNKVDPPKWVKDSNKWFKREFQDLNNNTIKIEAPFEQLSNRLVTGVKQLRDRQTENIKIIIAEKNESLKEIDKRLKDAEQLNEPLRQNEIDSIDTEKQEMIKIFDSLIDTITDSLDGKNISGINYIDDNDPSKGINSPFIINEYIGKNRGSQLRQKYYPEQISTVQSYVNSNGDTIEPYIYTPTLNLNYIGQTFNVEVPLAFSNQLSSVKNYSNSVFLNNKEIESSKKGIRSYSNKTIIKSLDLNPKNEEKPFIDNSKTYFSNNIKNDYIPDNVKNYYMPLEWNEVFEYDIKNKRTGETIRKEIEIVPFKVDIENDYELRVIKVINAPLISDSNSSNLNLLKSDVLVFIGSNYFQFFKSSGASKNIINCTFTNKQTTIDITFPTLQRSNKFNSGRYIDDSVFKQNTYFLFKPLEKESIDSNKIFKISNINHIWSTGVGTFYELDANQKTIKMSSSYIHTYLNEYRGDSNFKFTTGSNINKNFRIYDIVLISDNIYMMKFNTTEKNVISETLASITFNYLESSDAETFEYFESGNSSVEAWIYNIDSLDYVPESLKENSTFFIKGLDDNSFYSTINKRLANKGIDVSQYLNQDSVDTIYTIDKIETIDGIRSVVLNKSLNKKFVSDFYSTSKNSNLYHNIKLFSISSIKESLVSNNYTSETGTILADLNNIPEPLNLSDYSKTLHSTIDIDESNGLKEGVIFQGLDTRFINIKTFYLIEAIKKDTDGLAYINGKKNPDEKKNSLTNDTNKNQKEWYGLLDKFGIFSQISSKLIPLIARKMIPLLIKIIKTITNPKKIKDLILSIVIDESVSKVPKHFKYLQKKELEKAKKHKVKKDFDNSKKSNLVYDEPQTGKDNPVPIHTMDGQAFIGFGKGSIGKDIISFGCALEAGELKSISKLEDGKKDHNVFNIILNFIKLPFEVILKIFKWILDWVKKLLNPAKIAQAFIEFLSFEWLKNILGKDSLLSILGMADVESIISGMKGFLKDLTGKTAQEAYDAIIAGIRGDGIDDKFVEVFVYDILMNGVKIREEVVEKPYSSNGSVNNDSSTNNGNTNSEVNNNTGNENGNVDNKACSGNYSLLSMFPSPFMSGKVSYNDCNKSEIFLKPLESVGSILQFIQEILNAFLGIPIALLGLDPTIKIPKFGEEIPFYDIFEKYLNELKSELVMVKF